jgi:hypothetical protein
MSGLWYQAARSRLANHCASVQESPWSRFASGASARFTAARVAGSRAGCGLERCLTAATRRAADRLHGL